MVTELVAGELTELAVDAAITVIKKQKSNQDRDLRSRTSGYLLRTGVRQSDGSSV